MGRGRKRRRRRNRSGTLAEKNRVEFALRPLDFELAAAHDGFLRGAVEVRAVVALCVVRPDGRVLLVVRRLLKQNALSNDTPQTLKLEGRGGARQPFAVDRGAEVVVLAFLFEEDSGSALKQAYADVEHLEDVTVWRDDDPHPLTLDALAGRGFLPGEIYPVHVAKGERGYADAKGDKFVGACAARFPYDADNKRLKRDLRLAATSLDAKNAWTLRIRLEWKGP